MQADFPTDSSGVPLPPPATFSIAPSRYNISSHPPSAAAMPPHPHQPVPVFSAGYSPDTEPVPHPISANDSLLPGIPAADFPARYRFSSSLQTLFANALQPYKATPACRKPHSCFPAYHGVASVPPTSVPLPPAASATPLPEAHFPPAPFSAILPSSPANFPPLSGESR